MRSTVVSAIFLVAVFLKTFAGTNTFEGNLTITSGKSGAVGSSVSLAVKNDQIAINPGTTQQMVLNVKSGDFFSVVNQGANQKMVAKMNLSVLSGMPEMPAFLGPFSDYLGAGSKSQAQVTATDETKTINGFKCRKYVIKEEASTATVWLTQDIPFSITPLLEMLKLTEGMDATMKASFPLEGSIIDNKTSEVSNFKVSVEKKTVDEKLFILPEGMPVLDMTPLVKQMMETNDPAQIKTMIDRLMPK
ncbi:MAG: DUF4412 domain-containing protein [Chitinophagales bacterium]|nr:DUF4412 domain-containing protein [Chitinophagales bacterium]